MVDHIQLKSIHKNESKKVAKNKTLCVIDMVQNTPQKAKRRKPWEHWPRKKTKLSKVLMSMKEELRTQIFEDDDIELIEAELTLFVENHIGVDGEVNTLVTKGGMSIFNKTSHSMRIKIKRKD